MYATYTGSKSRQGPGGRARPRCEPPDSHAVILPPLAAPKSLAIPASRADTEFFPILAMPHLDLDLLIYICRDLGVDVDGIFTTLGRFAYLSSLSTFY